MIIIDLDIKNAIYYN